MAQKSVAFTWLRNLTGLMVMMMITEKEREKIDHYQDLKVEIQKLWNCRSVSVVLVVIGALGALTENLMMWVTKIGTPAILNLLQKACLLGTAKILRRTLDT